MTRSIADIEARINYLKEKKAGANDNGYYATYLDGMIDALKWAIGEKPRLEV